MLFIALPALPVTKAVLDAFGVVYITSAQTITGLKTFSTLPRSSVDPTHDDELTRRRWVLNQIAAATGALDWQDSVLDKDLTAPPTPTLGNRYIVATGGTGTWSGHDDDIAEGDGSGWDFTTPNEGFACLVEDENIVYVFITGTGWGNLASILDHGTLLGLADDDHTQYILANGSRALAGNWSLGGFNLTSAAQITGNDDIEITDATKGLILRDTQGTPHKWRVTIDNTGNLVTTDLGVA